MKMPISVATVQFLLVAVLNAQTPQAAPNAAKSLQESQSPAAISAVSDAVFSQVKLPAGTRIDVETTYTVSSMDLAPGDLLSFRVLVPVKVDDVTVIDQYALVTGRVVRSKRGGHWGKAGKLTWVMQDVVAVDLTRVPLTLQPDTVGERGVTGISHGGEVATKTAVLGALMIPVFPIAPLALMSGFKRGENAVLPGGRRFVVYVAANTMIKIRNER
jgi:hypothetical protein